VILVRLVLCNLIMSNTENVHSRSRQMDVIAHIFTWLFGNLVQDTTWYRAQYFYQFKLLCDVLDLCKELVKHHGHRKSRASTNSIFVRLARTQDSTIFVMLEDEIRVSCLEWINSYPKP
jgi:hypothetical protein